MIEWYYRLGETVQGPISESDLKHILNSGAVPLTTAIWREGMKDWVEANIALKLTIADMPAKCEAQAPVQKPAATFRISFKWLITFAVLACLIGVSIWAIHNKHTSHNLVTEPENKLNVGVEVKRSTGDISVPGSNTKTQQADINTLKQSSHISSSDKSTMLAALDKPGLEPSGSDAEKMNSYFVLASQCNDHLAAKIYNHREGEKDEVSQEARLSFKKSLRQLSAVARKQIVSADKILITNLGINNEKVHEVAQYIYNKINRNLPTNQKVEIGCIGQSELWVYRISSYDNKDEMIGMQTQIFSLKDIDPTSGKVGYQSNAAGMPCALLSFNCFNNNDRSIVVNDGGYSQLANKISIWCADESDARRVGKALGVLIVACGGKGELFDDSKSF